VLTYESAADIEAAPRQVWDVLVDVARWSEWDSGVLAVEGAVAPGARLSLRIAATPGRAFTLRVVELTAPTAMTWRGGMPLGLFTGTRTYRLAPRAGGTHFVMREVYTGPMLPLVARSMPDLQPSFDEFAAGLKHRVELGPPADPTAAA
jgi:hypothetical protein